MKYYLVTVTTQYDGYEWSHRTVITAQNEQSAENKVAKIDFTHENDIEVQYEPFAIEISKEDYEVLKKYI